MEAVTKIELPGIEKFKSGKVREVYDLGDQYLFIASDRISAFDVIMPDGIPNKGQVLNMISKFWFERTEDVVKNHMISTDVNDFPEILQPHRELLKGRSMLVKKAELLPVECIVRGYLIGSGWKEYQKSGTIGGMPLRPGYEMAGKIDEPIFTPSTKADEGHDENISIDQMKEIVGDELGQRLMDISLHLYKTAADFALTKGIIMADTKFEFGMIGDELILIDEVLTPDSSRFWPAADYAPGSSPLSFDKQFVRDYLETLDWDKTPPGPSLPTEIIEKSREKYLEAYSLLTGEELSV
ncbi:MAG: phosphoribosylaminoimidazolesuccinocarboxamide synthase [Kiritimatiellaceae bacterium]|nr:phosphoribosylaminoimidazolesuccinocarboxamide synthase [Kiritimatiellaceae bacterium]RZO88250.1 MAG: phosphoribosylaminoimidazolesuccinocarboxamide synthase [Kiritimatiellaceae bacterium]|tara:strand:+ start:244 stop:1134 length:891 start_codon:yes stop_codon:yes gene_type:complete